MSEGIANLNCKATVTCYWPLIGTISVSGQAVTVFKSSPAFTVLRPLWGGQNSNSYSEITDVASFLTVSVVDVSKWTLASKVQKEAAILQATLDIDSQQYVGGRYYKQQFLEFPRSFSTEFLESYTSVGSMLSTYEQTRIKESVRKATAYQALFLLRNSGRNVHAERVAAGIRSVSESTGSISDSISYSWQKKSRLCPEAHSLLNPWRTTKRILRG